MGADKVKNNNEAKKLCKGFEKGENGFCKYYMGCLKYIENCYNECSYKKARIQ